VHSPTVNSTSVGRAGLGRLQRLGITLGDGAGEGVLLREDRSAVLLLRVWLESDAEGFRARLTEMGVGDPEGPAEDHTYAVAASPRDVLRSVSQWLDEFLEADPVGD
jgi:hypothetical protein